MPVGGGNAVLSLPSHTHSVLPTAWLWSADSDSSEEEEFNAARVAEAAAREAAAGEGGRDQVYRGAKARTIRYKEFSESGGRAHWEVVGSGVGLMRVVEWCCVACRRALAGSSAG